MSTTCLPKQDIQQKDESTQAKRVTVKAKQRQTGTMKPLLTRSLQTQTKVTSSQSKGINGSENLSEAALSVNLQ